MARKYRIGIAGFDHWYVANAAAESAARDPRLELVAIAHRDPERLAEAAERYGAKHATTDYREVVVRDDVDVVVTACYTSENADLAVAAAEAGKHIVSVKPIAMTVADADRIVSAVRAAGVKFISNESPYRTYPAITQMKRWLDAGKLGKPITAYTCLRAPIPRQWWPGRFGETWWLDPKKSPGGGWLDHALYHVDTLRWLFGSEVAQVSGLVDNVMDKTLAPGLEDFGVANVVFEKGQIAVIEVTWTARVGGSYNAFQVVGTEGQAVWDQTTSGKLSAVGNFEQPGWFQVDAGPLSYSVLDHLIDCLENDRPTVADASDARTNLAVCLAFYEAARSGRPVSLK